MNREADQIIASLVGGVLGYALALTIYFFVGIPYAMAVLFGLCVACLCSLIVSLLIRLKLEKQERPPPKSWGG